MTDAPLSFNTSEDGKTWSKAKNIVNGYSDFGVQMAVYRGELYGIMTQTVQYPNYLFATKYKVNEGWKSWRGLPGNLRALGRVSVTVLDDRFFIAHRGMNDGVYLISTNDFTKFNDLGRVGSEYSKTVAAPAIAAFDGKLYIAGVGADKYIYYTVVDINGTRALSWTKIPGTGTKSSLSMAVYNGELYLLHCGYNNDKFHYQSLKAGGKEWSKLSSVTTNITSGLSATAWKSNSMVVSYRGKDEDIKLDTFDGGKWLGKTYVPNVYIRYQTCLATWGGELIVSYATKKASKSVMGYVMPTWGMMTMNEKSGTFGKVQEVDDEWDCKWNDEPEQKSLIKKWLCLK